VGDSEQLGKYQLVKCIARGGMAEIFLARVQGPAGFEKGVVVKRVLPHLSESSEFVQMFLDEARLAARLSHPNIVQIFDFGESDGSYFLCMEHLAGEDLANVVRLAQQAGGTMPFPLAAMVVSAAADALHYAHTLTDEGGQPLGIVHRDISPSNIFLTYTGAVKVLDFGIAKAQTKAVQTQAGVIKGKLMYMAPEQAKGKAVDGRSDVWALGAVLHEALTGQRLFARDTELAIYHAVLHDPIPSPSEIEPQIPEELSAIVMRALERDLAQRFASAADLRRALDTYVTATSTGPLGPQLQEYLKGLCGLARIQERARIPSKSSPSPAPQTPASGKRRPAEVAAAPARGAVADEPTQALSSGFGEAETALKPREQATTLLAPAEGPKGRGNGLGWGLAAFGALAFAGA